MGAICHASNMMVAAQKYWKAISIKFWWIQPHFKACANQYEQLNVDNYIWKAVNFM